MKTDRIFLYALVISFAVHGAVLLQNAGFNVFSPDRKPEKIEVSYIKESPNKPKLDKTVPVFKEGREFLPLPSKITLDNTKAPQYPQIPKELMVKSPGSFSRETIFTKPVAMKPDVIAIKKKITLPPVNLDKINNPSYISYYQIVREKIRRAAYQNYSRIDTGEVYLTFVVAGDGSLQQVRVVDERSSAKPYLKDIARKSLQEASPFPRFPEALNYPELSFNVIISFEVE